jgi:hypothetical protein
MTDRFSDEGQPNSDFEERREGCWGNGHIVSVANCLLTVDSSMRYLLIFIDTHVVCESGHLPRTVAERWATALFSASPPRTPEAYPTHFL